MLVVLGLDARYAGVDIFKLVRYLREELLVILGTSSSESVLPQLMKKLEHLGIPAGRRADRAHRVLAEVTGSGFIVLAATLSTVGTIPVAAIMLVFGIDKFMSECRALTNMMGNSVATLVVAKCEGQFDVARARRILNREEDVDEMASFDEDLVTLPNGAGTPALSGSIKV